MMASRSTCEPTTRLLSALVSGWKPTADDSVGKFMVRFTPRWAFAKDLPAAATLDKLMFSVGQAASAGPATCRHSRIRDAPVRQKHVCLRGRRRRGFVVEWDGPERRHPSADQENVARISPEFGGARHIPTVSPLFLFFIFDEKI